MLEVIILSFALSMDAFAVSIGVGIKTSQKDRRMMALKVGLLFGFFQAFMPFIGYLGGKGIQEYTHGYDYMIAFILLSLIGAKMIYESFTENTEDEITKVSNKILLFLAIATSIDAMAAGFSLHLFSLNIIISLLLIGIITFVMSYIGVCIGGKGSAKYEAKAEFLGGVILILIGLKIIINRLLA
jgi:manganese efflux pump family protein